MSPQEKSWGFINNGMLTFKQFLIEDITHNPNGISNQIQNMLNLIGLDTNTKKKLTDAQSELALAQKAHALEDGIDTASKARMAQHWKQMQDIGSQIDTVNMSDPIRTLDSQNMRVKAEKGLDPGDFKLDNRMPEELQKVQRGHRTAAFERANLVPPADDILEPVSISASSPRLDDIASRAAAGEPNAMDLRVDAKGKLRSNDVSTIANQLLDNPLVKKTGTAVLKSLPIIGTAASLAAMTQRAQAGDYTGAGLEAASEIADYIPVVGTAASLGIQGYLADRDMPEEEKKKQKDNTTRQYLRSLGQGFQFRE